MAGLSKAKRLDRIGNVNVPNGWDEALMMIKKQSNVLHRKPHDQYHQKINEGVETGAKFTAFKQELMSNLAQRIGKEDAERFASLFCVTGLVPDPTGSMGALQTDEAIPPLVKHILCFVTALSKKVYGLEPVFHNYPVNAESSTTVPYYARGADGVFIKKAYHQTYMDHGPRIKEELATQNWKALHSCEYHLPIFFTGTTGLRIQPRGMKEVFWSGYKIVKCVIKPNRVTNWKGDEVDANMDIPGSDLDKTGKGRGVAAQSSSSNQLLSEILSPVREAMYQKGIWHASDWVEVWAQVFKSLQALGFSQKDIIAESTDFSRMDAHMRRPFMEAILEGMRRAGWSDAVLILKRKIEFSPMLCPCDSKTAPPEDSYARMLGRENDETVTEYDAAHHSGSGNTDMDNGIYGVSSMTVVELWAGNIRCPGYSRDLPADERLIQLFEKWIDDRWDTYFECIPTPGDRMCPVGNKGDDNVNVHLGTQASLAFAAALKDAAPYLDIAPEPRTTFLGNIFNPDGTGYAAEDNFLVRHLCPERSVADRPFALPLGTPARNERFCTNPFVVEHLLPVLEQTTAKFYGDTWTRLAQMAPMPEAVPQPINAAEVNFLYDHSVLSWKYAYEGDIRPELVQAVGAFFFVPAADIEKLYTLFRRN